MNELHNLLLKKTNKEKPSHYFSYFLNAFFSLKLISTKSIGGTLKHMFLHDQIIDRKACLH